MKFSGKYLQKTCFFVLFSAFVLNGYNAFAENQEENKYVGVDACIDCHEEIVNIYRKTSSKAKSDKSVLLMREKLTTQEFQGCLSCHTTGYGEPSGFKSFEQTPHLAVVGCESCHGMGYLHSQDGSPESIMRTPPLELCETCHDASKVEPIHYDGRIHAGGH